MIRPSPHQQPSTEDLTGSDASLAEVINNAKVMWSPPNSQQQTPSEAAGVSAFRSFVLGRLPQLAGKLDTFGDIYQWSITDLSQFWQQVWDFGGIIASKQHDGVVVDETLRMDAIPEWFVGARLNYAENMLRFNDDHIALLAVSEDSTKPPRPVTYKEVREQVRLFASALKRSLPNLKPGDRVAAYSPNTPETLIFMLACASLGLLWSSVAPELGAPGVLQRFQQIEPTVLFSVDQVNYNGKTYGHVDKLAAVVQGLPTLQKVVVVPLFADRPLPLPMQNAETYSNFLTNAVASDDLMFEQLPFSHPLFIMYSSGTTGIPKCIVHSAGGALIQHIKEHKIHSAVKRSDVFLYYTTTSWMMWQWHVSALALGCTVVLYDGSPLPPSAPLRLWDLVDQIKLTLLGASARYLQTLQDKHLHPNANHSLQSLRVVYSTGSPLLPDQFDFVYKHIKQDLVLGSITGGTDILSLFAGCDVELPVRRGQITARLFGMAVEAWDDDTGVRVPDGFAGDLVCTRPFPIMPVYFYGKDGKQKYHDAYFSRFDGVWYHGDYLVVSPDSGGIVMLGRSDGTLKPGGVRFGSAELYNVMNNFKEVSDSVAVGQRHNGDERVILFCKMAPGLSFTPELETQIRKRIREELSPRHVPAIILSIEDIPYTQTGKKVELAIKKILAGAKNVSSTALANPESLKLYEHLLHSGAL